MVFSGQYFDEHARLVQYYLRRDVHSKILTKKVLCAKVFRAFKDYIKFQLTQFSGSRSYFNLSFIFFSTFKATNYLITLHLDSTGEKAPSDSSV